MVAAVTESSVQTAHRLSNLHPAHTDSSAPLVAHLISRYQLQGFHLPISHPHLHDGLFLDDDDADFKSGMGTSGALTVAVQVLGPVQTQRPVLALLKKKAKQNSLIYRRTQGKWRIMSMNTKTCRCCKYNSKVSVCSCHCRVHQLYYIQLYIDSRLRGLCVCDGEDCVCEGEDCVTACVTERTVCVTEWTVCVTEGTVCLTERNSCV